MAEERDGSTESGAAVGLRGLPPMTPEEQWAAYTRYFYLLCKMLFFGAMVYAVYWVLTTLSSVVFPLFISLLVAYLLDPAVDMLEERKVPRSVGILICLMLLLSLLFFVALFLYPTVARQFGNIAERVPQLIEMLETRTLPWVEETFDYRIPPTWTEVFGQYSEDLKNAAPSVLRKIGEWTSGLVGQTGAIMVSLLNAIMIPIFTFYFLRDFDKMTAWGATMLPSYRREFLESRIRMMDTVVGEWFRGQLQVAGILAVLYAVGLSIVFSLADIDVNSGVAIGLVTGILNVVPYFGVAIGLVLSLLVVVLEWVGFLPILGVAAVFMVVQTLEGYLITPKIVGEKVGLSPVTVIIVLLIGGELFGLLGILLAIPVVGALKVITPDLIESYRASAFFSGRRRRPAPASVVLADAEPSEMSDRGGLEGGSGGGPADVPDQADSSVRGDGAEAAQREDASTSDEQAEVQGAEGEGASGGEVGGDDARLPDGLAAREGPSEEGADPREGDVRGDVEEG